MKEQWELAKILIDAKKALDSLWYISKYTQQLQYNARDLCYDKRSRYYINVCAILDKTICNDRNKKKQLQQNDSNIRHLYYERDKYYAHKDDNYIPLYPYASIKAEVLSLQQELQHIKSLCIDFIPKIFTIDFICYDGELFRRINKISPEDEEKINKQKYPLVSKYFNFKHPIEKRILWDIDDLKLLTDDERKNCGLILKDGLTLEERLHNLQDFCISFNILFNKDIWCSLNKKLFDECISLRDKGFFNEFNIIQLNKLCEIIISGESLNLNKE